MWAARKVFDQRAARWFCRFLELDASNAEKKVLLDLLNATKYMRAEDASYDKLRAGSAPQVYALVLTSDWIRERLRLKIA